MKRILIALAITLAQTFPTHAQDQSLYWLQEVTDQIAAAEECEVAYIRWYREYTVMNVDIQEAKVMCMDRREFDARRELPEFEFTFTDCTPTVC